MKTTESPIADDGDFDQLEELRLEEINRQLEELREINAAVAEENLVSE
jgi:hypothetical protein